jgi:hypothetical protein
MSVGSGFVHRRQSIKPAVRSGARKKSPPEPCRRRFGKIRRIKMTCGTNIHATTRGDAFPRFACEPRAQPCSTTVSWS